MKNNITLRLFSLVPTKLLALIRLVASELGLNVSLFASPTVPVATLTSKADELEVAITKASTGGVAERETRDRLVEEVREMLRTEADYVRSVCGGDGEKLAKSGFTLSRQREPIGQLPATAYLKATATGITGQVKLRWADVHGAHSFEVSRSFTDPAQGATWELVTVTTRVSCLVDNMTPYKACWFSVAAIGAAGKGVACDPALGRAA